MTKINKGGWSTLSWEYSYVVQRQWELENVSEEDTMHNKHAKHERGSVSMNSEYTSTNCKGSMKSYLKGVDLSRLLFCFKHILLTKNTRQIDRIGLESGLLRCVWLGFIEELKFRGRLNVFHVCFIEGRLFECMFYTDFLQGLLPPFCHEWLVCNFTGGWQQAHTPRGSDGMWYNI